MLSCIQSCNLYSHATKVSIVISIFIQEETDPQKVKQLMRESGLNPRHSGSRFYREKPRPPGVLGRFGVSAGI